jgi:hypothetical protein
LVALEEADLNPAVKAKIDVLKDRLAKETFFRDVTEIEQAATAVGNEYKRRYDLALDARVAAYADAVAKLEQTPGWERLDPEQKEEVARPLRQCADRARNNQTISHLRSVRDACEGRLATAIEKVHKIPGRRARGDRFDRQVLLRQNRKRGAARTGVVRHCADKAWRGRLKNMAATFFCIGRMSEARRLAAILAADVVG